MFIPAKIKYKRRAKLHLTIHERLILGGLLKQEADFLTIAIQKDIKAKVAIDAELREAIGMVAKDGMITWNEDKAKEHEKDIEFTPAEISHFKACVTALDQAQKINDENFDLVKKIKEL